VACTSSARRFTAGASINNRKKVHGCNHTSIETERPIIFSAAMVRAILEGRKTQTGRIVKDRALEWHGGFSPDYVASPEDGLCPYGQPGDRLWVPETFKPCDCGHAMCKGAVWAADFA
jgi:hypothetical protein